MTASCAHLTPGWVMIRRSTSQYAVIRRGSIVMVRYGLGRGACISAARPRQWDVICSSQIADIGQTDLTSNGADLGGGSWSALFAELSGLDLRQLPLSVAEGLPAPEENDKFMLHSTVMSNWRMGPIAQPGSLVVSLVPWGWRMRQGRSQVKC